MKRISLMGIVCVMIFLAACSHSQPTAIPEWKLAYFDLIEKTMTGELEPRGIAIRHTIELLDYDGDGIPELQEEYTRNAPEYHVIWFVEDGQARAMTGEHQLWESNRDNIKFEGLWRNNETGAHVLTDSVNYSHTWGEWEVYFYEPTENKGLWRLACMISWQSGYSAIDSDRSEPYDDWASYITSYDGEKEFIQNAEAQRRIESFYASHTRLQGEALSLESLYPWSDETAKTVSDFFDAHDGIPSNVAQTKRNAVK